MPSGDPKLHGKWGPDESRAFRYLFASGFKLTRGGVWHPRVGYQWGWDVLAEEAIDYLCDEWDYAYDPRPWGPWSWVFASDSVLAARFL